MTYTIRDNNGNIVCSVENTTTLSYESINNEIDSINEYSNKLNKSIEAFNFISDTRAMEALGYEKGAGFKANAKAIGHEIWKRIKEFFGRIKQAFIDLGKWIVKIFDNIKNHFNEKKAKKGAEVLSKACDGAKTVDEVAEKLKKEYEEKNKIYTELDNEYTKKRNEIKEYFNELLDNEEFKNYCINLKKITVLGSNYADSNERNIKNILDKVDIFPIDIRQGLKELKQLCDAISKYVNEKRNYDFYEYNNLFEYKYILKRIEQYELFDKDASLSESEITEVFSKINPAEVTNARLILFKNEFKESADKASELCDKFTKLIENISELVNEDHVTEEAKEYAEKICMMILYSQKYLSYYIKTATKMPLEMASIFNLLIKISEIDEQSISDLEMRDKAEDQKDKAYREFQNAMLEKL